MTDDNRMRILAWLNVGLHLLGLGASGVGMRPASPLVPLPERMERLARGPLDWSLAWGVWMLCALALVAFFAGAARSLARKGHCGRDLPWLALVLVTAGAAVDLFCDSIQIAVLPLVAAEGPNAALLFRALERAAGVGGLIAANGLYALGTLLLTLSLRGLPGTATARALGWATFAGAMLLVVAGFTGDAWHAAVVTVPTIGLLCVWVAAVARALET